MKNYYLTMAVCGCLSLGLTSPSFSKVLETQDEFESKFTEEKTFIEKYLPWLNITTKKKEVIDPTRTMTSPFSTGAGLNSNSGISNLYDLENNVAGNKQKGLHLSHKSHSELERWILEAIGTSFNFSLSDMNSFKGKLQPYYSDNGIGEFKKLLLNMNTIAIMKSNNKKLSSYITDTPSLKREGVSGGLYTWLYDSYVIISYVDDSSRSKSVPVINRKYRIRAKLSQTDNINRHDAGIKIDSISAKKLKIEEPEEGTK